MKKKLDLELKKYQILKVARTAIRLKYSLLADEALNNTLPDLERDIDIAIADGKEFNIDAASYIDGMLK